MDNIYVRLGGLVQRLSGVRDLKRILETTVKEISDSLQADCCQIMLSNPLDSNVTSICEYRQTQEELETLPKITFPLVLQGSSFGSVSLRKRTPVLEAEVSAMRVTAGELGGIIRQAQINDMLQRDTFRDTFLVEIGNVMAYSLGIGDALFMVVNILGKVLQASRCLFICTDDTQVGWKCYEFWQQEKVQSCQDFRWPTTDSAVVAQTLLSTVPLKLSEGQQNSYISPVQEELQFIGVRSLLGIALRSSYAVHGCVILQQCDYRRAWTRGEIDMVQNVADKVAEALFKLPAEKRAREPIMQLHQRTVANPNGDDGQSIQSVRNALKGALGQQAIPSANKTSTPVAPKPAAVPNPLAQAQAPATIKPPQPPVPPPQAAPPTPVAQASAPTVEFAKPSETAMPPPAVEPGPPGMVLKSVFDTAAPKISSISRPGGPAPPTAEADPYANLDIDEFAETVEGSAPAVDFSPPQPTPAPVAEGNGSALDLSGLDAIPTPQAAPPKAWGDLDSIPTPKGGTQPQSGPGLGRRLNKGKITHHGMQSALLTSLHKDKAAFAKQKSEAAEPFVEGPPIQIDETEAKAKLDKILASSNQTSDYIFDTPGLDPRMAGRIDGWVQEIEQKDKYIGGHAKEVAELSVATAKQLGLPEEEIKTIRVAALVHDVGKLGAAPQVLQKRDEELTDPELITIMQHPLTGAELLTSFTDLAPLAEIVCAHHEEFDGNGYPRGLKGEEIPLAARIIYTANAYYGLTAQMKYGPGIAKEAAIEELQKGSGQQHDPQVLKAFLAIIA
jgi:putative nucleotidyltransferase with HDIG domain